LSVSRPFAFLCMARHLLMMVTRIINIPLPRLFSIPSRMKGTLPQGFLHSSTNHSKVTKRFAGHVSMSQPAGSWWHGHVGSKVDDAAMLVQMWVSPHAYICDVGKACVVVSLQSKKDFPLILVDMEIPEYQCATSTIISYFSLWFVDVFAPTSKITPFPIRLSDFADFLVRLHFLRQTCESPVHGGHLHDFSRRSHALRFVCKFPQVFPLAWELDKRNLKEPWWNVHGKSLARKKCIFQLVRAFLATPPKAPLPFQCYRGSGHVSRAPKGPFALVRQHIVSLSCKGWPRSWT
jgi:hypothetical protein